MYGLYTVLVDERGFYETVYAFTDKNSIEYGHGVISDGDELLLGQRLLSLGGEWNVSALFL